MKLTWRRLWYPLGILTFCRSLWTIPVLAQNDGDDGVGGRGLSGTWSVKVTLTNCQTGETIGNPFPSYLSFAGNGTMTEETEQSGFRHWSARGRARRLEPNQAGTPTQSRAWRSSFTAPPLHCPSVRALLRERKQSLKPSDCSTVKSGRPTQQSSLPTQRAPCTGMAAQSQQLCDSNSLFAWLLQRESSVKIKRPADDPAFFLSKTHSVFRLTEVQTGVRGTRG